MEKNAHTHKTVARIRCRHEHPVPCLACGKRSGAGGDGQMVMMVVVMRVTSASPSIPPKPDITQEKQAPRGGHLASQSSALGAQEGRQGQAGCEVGRREHSMGCPAGRLQESAGVAQDECNTNE